MIKRIVKAFVIATISLISSITCYAANSSILSIDYTDSKDLITSNDDLFSNISSFMPGDILSDTLNISNNNSNSVELFFKSIPLSADDYELKEDYELLNSINLLITLDNQTVYNGSLAGKELSDIISLGKFKSGQSGEFKFTLSVPTNLKNEFNMTKTKVKWYFAVTEEKIPVISTPDEPQQPQQLNVPVTNSVVKEKDTTPSPYTGFKAATGIIGTIGVLTASALAILKSSKRKERSNEKI